MAVCNDLYSSGSLLIAVIQFACGSISFCKKYKVTADNRSRIGDIIYGTKTAVIIQFTHSATQTVVPDTYI